MLYLTKITEFEWRVILEELEKLVALSHQCGGRPYGQYVRDVMIPLDFYPKAYMGGYMHKGITMQFTPTNTLDLWFKTTHAAKQFLEKSQLLVDTAEEYSYRCFVLKHNTVIAYVNLHIASVLQVMDCSCNSVYNLSPGIFCVNLPDNVESLESKNTTLDQILLRTTEQFIPMFEVPPSQKEATEKVVATLLERGWIVRQFCTGIQYLPVNGVYNSLIPQRLEFLEQCCSVSKDKASSKEVIAQMRAQLNLLEQRCN